MLETIVGRLKYQDMYGRIIVQSLNYINSNTYFSKETQAAPYHQ